MKLIFEGKNKYRVWYRPYSYPDEEDFIDVTANTEQEAVEFARTLGYETEVELKEESITEGVENKDIMDLLTSERVDLMIKAWQNLTGSLSMEKCLQYFEKLGYDCSGYTNEEFNRVWDLACDEFDNRYGVEEEEEDSVDGIETKEDAYRWLQDKLEEYGNTYHFPNEDRYKLDRLIDKFGSTYFWRR